MTERAAPIADTQLRLPRKIVVRDGDVVEAVKSEGIVRVTFVGGLDVSIEHEPFLVDSKAGKRALAALGRLLDSYVSKALTEAGWRSIDDQRAVDAGTERGTMEPAIERSFNSLLNQGLRPADVEGFIRVSVASKARGAEVHMGFSHPDVESVTEGLADLLSEVVEARKRGDNLKTAKPTVPNQPLQARMEFGH